MCVSGQYTHRAHNVQPTTAQPRWGGMEAVCLRGATEDGLPSVQCRDISPECDRGRKRKTENVGRPTRTGQRATQRQVCAHTPPHPHIMSPHDSQSYRPPPAALQRALDTPLLMPMRWRGHWPMQCDRHRWCVCVCVCVSSTDTRGKQSCAREAPSYVAISSMHIPLACYHVRAHPTHALL